MRTNIARTAVVLLALVNPAAGALASQDYGTLSSQESVPLAQRISANPVKTDKWSSTEQTRHFRLEGTAIFRFLDSLYSDLRDSDCVRGFLSSPGHLARVASGYYVQTLFLSIRYVENNPTELRVMPVYRSVPDSTRRASTEPTKAGGALAPEFNCRMR